MQWTESKVEQLKELWEQGSVAIKIAKELEEQKKLGYEVGRLQVSHDNDLWNQELEKIKKEFIELVNERGK